MKKILLLLLCLTLLGGCNIEEQVEDPNDEIKKNQIIEEVVNVNMLESKGYSDITLLIEDVKPSVVDIYSYSTKVSSAGSGVIIGKKDGAYYIVTNHHVIDGANQFEVVTYNSEGMTTTYEASLVGTSPKSDVAILEIGTNDELKITTIISDSNKVKIGTEVVAIGNPLGILGGSVTHGIISATEREVYISEIGYMRLFQTDAAINSGNSGGALFNYEGALIGIVNSGYTNYEGLNFAIPSNIVMECFESIIETKTETSLGYLKGETELGFTLAETIMYNDKNLTSQVNVIYVSQVENNSDASNNNILDYESFSRGKTEVFYALSKINGKEIDSLTNAIKLLDEIKSGEEVEFEFIEISYVRTSGFFGQTAVYLTNNIQTITFVPSQFVYIMP